MAIENNAKEDSAYYGRVAFFTDEIINASRDFWRDKSVREIFDIIYCPLKELALLKLDFTKHMFFSKKINLSIVK